MELRPPESAAGAAAAMTGAVAAAAVVTETLAATVVAAPAVVVMGKGMMMGSVRPGESPGRVTVAGAKGTANGAAAAAAVVAGGAAVVATGAAADVEDLRGAKFSELGGMVNASIGISEVDADPADGATPFSELPSVPELSFSSSSEKVLKGSQLVRSDSSVFA